MDILKYIKKNNIEQICCTNELEDNINYFENLNMYSNIQLNTIFLYKNEEDIIYIKLHKGKKWIFFLNNVDTTNITELCNYDFEVFFCDNNQILNLVKEFNINCKNFNSKVINYNEIIKVNDKKSIVFLILASKKKEYENKLNNLLKYLETFSYDYFILLTGKDNIIEKNYIYVNIDDCWENIPKKIITAYDLIYKFTNYNFVYKVDDDFMNIKLNLSNNIFNYDYFGNQIITKIKRDYHFNKCKDDELNKTEYKDEFIAPYAGGGYGYLLSRKSINIILQNLEYFNYELYEDKAVGDILYKNNIILNQQHNCKNIVVNQNINNNLGFIIYKVNNDNDSIIKLYNEIRKYSNANIIIIDKNFNKSNDFKNVKIVKNEFLFYNPLLPYYYFINEKYFEKAVIIQDNFNIENVPSIFDNLDNQNIHFLVKEFIDDVSKDEFNVFCNFLNSNNLDINLKNKFLYQYKNEKKIKVTKLQTICNLEYLSFVNDKINLLNFFNKNLDTKYILYLQNYFGFLFSKLLNNGY